MGERGGRKEEKDKEGGVSKKLQVSTGSFFSCRHFEFCIVTVYFVINYSKVNNTYVTEIYCSWKQDKLVLYVSNIFYLIHYNYLFQKELG
jgi:hypothetical protein